VRRFNDGIVNVWMAGGMVGLSHDLDHDLEFLLSNSTVGPSMVLILIFSDVGLVYVTAAARKLVKKFTEVNLKLL